jgi:tellurite resistance protein TehA-like permease
MRIKIFAYFGTQIFITCSYHIGVLMVAMLALFMKVNYKVERRNDL